ncbi:aldo/keto reductase [Pseudomonas sp. JDS28PS106]|uniref:aldo/keto reductase n=1 Tax=Pseudomonas sp. JDS28PS106 TaxID=2497235 RepID=UPI002FD1E3E6
MSKILRWMVCNGINRMNATKREEWPRSSLTPTALGFGAAQLGNFKREMSEFDAQALIEASWEAGVRFYDTAPSYGHGLSEVRLGHALGCKPRDDYVLSTKVGRLLSPKAKAEIDFTPWVNGLPFDRHFDYTYDGAMRSIEDSLRRTGLARIDVALIHEVDAVTHGNKQPDVFNEAMNGAAKALLDLRDQGVVRAIGVGVNESDVALASIRRVDFDCVLLAGRYTLLEQYPLDDFLPLCHERQVSVIVGGGYNSGILATGSVAGAMYNYAPADDAMLNRVRRIESLCMEFGVPLKAAALQFILAHPVIKTVIPGCRSVKQLYENIETLNAVIPIEFWRALQMCRLIREEAPIPQDELQCQPA